MIKSKIVNKSELFYETKYDDSNINEYYQYILNTIILFLTKNNIPYSINFGCDNILKDINNEEAAKLGEVVSKLLNLTTLDLNLW